MLREAVEFVGSTESRPTKISPCKIGHLVFISHPQRVFEITPLVPGSPSLDVKPHSPGGTRP